MPYPYSFFDLYLPNSHQIVQESARSTYREHDSETRSGVADSGGGNAATLEGKESLRSRLHLHFFPPPKVDDEEGDEKPSTKAHLRIENSNFWMKKEGSNAAVQCLRALVSFHNNALS